MVNRNRLRDLENELMVPTGEHSREGKAREFGMYTLLYLKWITNKDLLNSTRNKNLKI